MSLEEKIEKLTATMENLIGALAAGQAITGATATNTVEKASKPAPSAKQKGKTRPAEEEPAETEEATETDDGFGAEEGEDDGFGNEAEPVQLTIQDVTGKLFEMRNAYCAKFGDDEGLVKARAVLHKYAKKPTDIPKERFQEAFDDIEAHIAKLAEAEKKTTKKAAK